MARQRSSNAHACHHAHNACVEQRRRYRLRAQYSVRQTCPDFPTLAKLRRRPRKRPHHRPQAGRGLHRRDRRSGRRGQAPSSMSTRTRALAARGRDGRLAQGQGRARRAMPVSRSRSRISSTSGTGDDALAPARSTIPDPAEHDAATVARLRKAGFVVIGRTNMTEFAYSGIGINPHYGTPKGACEPGRGPCARRLVLRRGGIRARRHGAWRARHRHRRLLPDLPAALNGIVGYKPTQRPCRSMARCRCRSRSTASGRRRDRSVAVPYSTRCSRTSRSPR